MSHAALEQADLSAAEGLPTQPAAILANLDELGLKTETFAHKAVFTVEESQEIQGAVPGDDCKSLFTKDKKGQLWLIIALGDSMLDMNKANKPIGAARLSFGKEDALFDALGVRPGSVTPFSVINDTEGAVNVVLEARMMESELLNYHPLLNTMSTTITPADLVTFLKAHNHDPIIAELPLRG